MLQEYALIPDIFDRASYTPIELYDHCLQTLKEPLLQEALVRNLRNGEWLQYLNEGTSSWPPHTKEIIKKLKIQNRLSRSSPILEKTPANYKEWCLEAIASHEIRHLNGIIASKITKEEFRDNAEIASIEKLTSASWWQSRSPSVRLKKNTDDYLKYLTLVLENANSLMFIDPHLDPTRHNYSEFIKIYQAIRIEEPKPHIEVHRVCYSGAGRNREILPHETWERHFKEYFATYSNLRGFSIEIFIWDDFHDRYLITDIIGISLPNGFDISKNQNNFTTWTRLGRRDREDVQREFDPTAYNKHKLRHRFKINT